METEAGTGGGAIAKSCVSLQNHPRALCPPQCRPVLPEARSTRAVQSQRNHKDFETLAAEAQGAALT
ncbi:MAG: hypothetical protein D6680_02025 [Cyanobacteria bacterium J007]|nr:MAG: hypothetical protein D6680_02025 [Cyanobacteria bacterium J007]